MYIKAKYNVRYGPLVLKKGKVYDIDEILLKDDYDVTMAGLKKDAYEKLNAVDIKKYKDDIIKLPYPKKKAQK